MNRKTFQINVFTLIFTIFRCVSILQESNTRLDTHTTLSYLKKYNDLPLSF